MKLGELRHLKDVMFHMLFSQLIEYFFSYALERDERFEMRDRRRSPHMVIAQYIGTGHLMGPLTQGTEFSK